MRRLQRERTAPHGATCLLIALIIQLLNVSENEVLDAQFAKRCIALHAILWIYQNIRANWTNEIGIDVILLVNLAASAFFHSGNDTLGGDVVWKLAQLISAILKHVGTAIF